MNASNDSSHSGLDQDRRSRFRIDDTAILEVSPIEVVDTENKRADSFFKASAPFNLMRKLRGIDQDNSGILRSIGEKNSEIALYLAAINKKVDAIGNAVAENILSEEHRLQSIDLSEGGIGFLHDEKLKENAYYAIKIWFHRALIGISVFVRVVACSRSIDGGQHISAAFHELPDAEKQVIARHIMQVQAEQQRSKKSGLQL